MRKCIIMELKKAFFQKTMAVVLALLLLLVILQAREAIGIGLLSLRYKGAGNPQLTASSAFVRWMGADTSSFWSTLFYFMFPLFATLPFGWSLSSEKKTGYTGILIGRVGRKKYFTAKAVAVFLAGAVVILLSLLMNFLLVSMYLPCLTPEVVYPYGALFQKSMWSGLYYEEPGLYVFLYILLDSFYGGVLALLSVTAAFYGAGRTTAVLVPFILYTAMEYIDSNFLTFLGTGYDFSPAKFLRAMPMANNHNGLIAASEAGVLLLFMVSTIMRKGRKYEAV
ncbi:hypothetical protein [Porcincola intestinalis]|nr:hypothetical protein [Porcincola intestinalis]